MSTFKMGALLRLGTLYHNIHIVRVFVSILLCVFLLPVSIASILRVTPVAAESGESLTTNLTNWYKFNEGTGTIAIDSIAPTANGTLINGPTYSTDVPPNTIGAGNSNSLNFDGVNDYVTVPTPGLPTGDFTYSTWIKPTDHNFGTTIFVAPNTLAGNEAALYFTAEGKVNVWTNNVNRFTGNKVAAPGIWTHVALTRVGSAITLYINGIVDGTASSNTALNFGGCALLIGVDTDLGCSTTLNEFWKGRMDDFRVYSSGLTQADIQTIFNTAQNNNSSKVPGGIGLQGTGTVGNPFTSLYAAYKSGVAAGVYNFAINGQTFSSYVDANGWVLVASSKASTNEAGYTQTNALTLQSDKILQSGIVSTLDVSSVRINASAGVTFDANTQSPLTISRLKLFTTLGYAPGDSNGWSVTSGTGALAATCSGSNLALNRVIWHSCGISTNLHWFGDNTVAGNWEGFASATDTADLNLWARGEQPILRGWYKADQGTSTTTNGAAVNSWKDSSGLNNDVYQDAPARQPKFSTNYINYNPTILFDDSDNFIRDQAPGEIWPGVGTEDDIGMYIVATETAQSGYTDFVSHPTSLGGFEDWFSATEVSGYPQYWIGGVAQNTPTPILTTGKPFIIGTSSPGATGTASRQLFYNGKTYSFSHTSLTLDLSSRKLIIGAENDGLSETLNGNIAEVILYNKNLSSTVDQDKIESYLASKYGMTLDQSAPTNYIAANSATIWNSSNTTFNNNITVIGREDISALNQKQSASINNPTEKITLSRGSLAASNAANTSTFTNDVSYLAAGDNNLTGTTTNTASCSILPATRTSRVFNLQSTNMADSNLVTVDWLGSYFDTNSQMIMMVADDAAMTTNVQLVPMAKNGATWSAPYLASGSKYIAFTGNTAIPNLMSGDKTINWLSTPWNGGTTIPPLNWGPGVMTQTIGDANFTHTVTDSGNTSYPKAFWSGYPSYYPLSVGDSLQWVGLDKGTPDTVTFESKITNGKVAKGASFVVHGIDTYYYKDTLKVEGFLGAAAVSPKLTDYSGFLDSVSTSGNTATGTGLFGNRWTPWGDVKVDFAGPVDRILVTYKPSATYSASALWWQEFSLSNIKWKGGNPPPAYTPADGVFVFKDITPTTVEVGQEQTVDFTFRNMNCGNKTINFSDILPHGTFLADTLLGAPAGTVNSYGGTNTLTITGATLPPGETTMSVKLKGTAIGSYTNQATFSVGANNYVSDVESTATGPDTTPYALIASTKTIPAVTLTKSANVAQTPQNGVVAYTLVVNNTSGVAMKADLADTLAGAQTYVTGSLALPGTVTGGYTIGNNGATPPAETYGGGNLLSLTGYTWPTGTTTITIQANVNGEPIGNTLKNSFDLTVIDPTFQAGHFNSNQTSVLLADILDVTLNQAPTQVDPQAIGASATNITFRATFTQDINTSTFTPSDITLGGTATGCSVTSITANPGAQLKTFDVLVNCGTSPTNHNKTIVVSLAASAVEKNGNPAIKNTLATYTDNAVTLNDVTPPVTLAPPDMTAVTDTGSSNTDNITNNSKPTFTGICVDGDTIQLYVDGVAITPTAVCSSASYSITPTNAITDGVRAITVKATDPVGNTSATSTALSVTIDTTAPVTPAATDMTAATDTGSSNTDNVTSNATPTFTGSCTTGEIITLLVDGSAVTPTVVCSAGTYTITPATAIASGSHSITTTATDVAGNTSVQSPTLAITIDTGVPTVPSTPDLATASDTGVSTTDNVTSDTSPTFDGTCTTGDTIKLYDGVTLVGTQVCAAGAYSITPTLTDGIHSITTTATNTAGTTSSASSALSITIDSAAPTAPTTAPDMTAATDTGSSNTDNVTSNASPTFTGTCTTGDIVTLFRDATAVVPTVSCIGGTYSITPTTPFANGTYNMTTKFTDPAGNQSAASPVTMISVDTTAPVAPAITSPANNSAANTATPTFSGTGENGATVTVKDENGNTVCTAVVSGGTWSCTATTQTDGTHTYTPTQTDVAGNTSPAGTPITLTVDTAAPIAPIISTVDGKPASPAPATNDNTPTITGTGEPGATVVVKDATTPLVCAEGNPLVIPPSGNWTCTPTVALTQGTHAITSTQTDPAGNVSPASTVVNVTIDTTPPTATVNQSAGQPDSTYLNSLNFTVVFSETINPTSFTASDLLITTDLASPSTRIATFAQVNATTWSVEIKDVTNGATVTVSLPVSTYADLAGNTGAASNSTDNQITYLVPPPNVDQLYTNNATPILSGQCAAGHNLTITVVGKTPANSPIVCGAGNTWSLAWPGAAIADGTYDVQVTDTTVPGLNNFGGANPNSSVGKLVIDTIKPTPTITRSLGQNAATNVDQAKFDINFDKPIVASSLVLADFTISNAPGSTKTLTQISPTKWELLITGMTNGNTVTIDLAANTTVDITGNLANTANLTSNTVLYDITAPAAPVVTSPAASSSTNDNTPTFSGTGETGATVTVKDQNGNVVCTAVVSGGTWSCTPATAIADGQQTFQVTQKDPAGNTSPATAIPLKIDTVVPVAPVVTAPAPNAITNDNTPTITGTGEPGATVVVKDGTTPLVCAEGNPLVIPLSGNWTCTPATALGEGAHSLTATQTDPAGNVSPATAPIAIMVDTVPPTAGVITSPTTGSSTNDNTPTVTGTGTAGDTVTVKDGAGNPILGCTNIVIPVGGNWTCTPVSPLPDGSTTLTPVTKDAAGNTTSGTPVTVAIDTVPPTAAVITSPTSGSATNDTTPTFAGTGTSGDKVTLKDSLGNPIPGCTNIVIPVSGNWTCTPTNQLPTGNNTITPVTTDTAGNTTTGSPIIVNVDTTPPAAPGLTTIDGKPASSNPATNDTTPTIAGTGTPGDTIAVKDGTTPLVCAEGNPLVIPPSGNWTCTPTTPLTQGNHSITATETDPAGNTSPASTPSSVVVDTTPPTAAVITGPTLTNDTTPTITGTGTPGDTVTLKDSLGNPIPGCTNIVIPPSGTWTCTVTSPLPPGNNTITPVTTDPAGNSTTGTPIVINIDTTPPTAAVITGPTLTNDTTPIITGTGTPGDTVTLKDGTGNPIPGCTNIVISVSSNWTCTPTNVLPEGTNTLTPVTTDPAGNQTTGSPVIITVDTVPPVAPTVGGPTNNSSTNSTTPPISGSGTPGNTIQVLVDGNPIVCTEGNPLIIPPSGNWTCTPTVPLTQGSHTITVKQLDPAGNASTPTSPIAITVDTSVPTAPVVNPITTPNSDNTPTITGTGEPGATVTITVAPTGEVITTTVLPNGTWSATPTTPIPDGPSSFAVKQTDRAGNVSPTTSVTGPVIDTTAPLAPIISGPTTGSILTTDLPTFGGTGEVGAVVKVYDELGLLVCTTTVDALGNWTCTPTVSQGEGVRKYTAVQTDLAGNPSPNSAPPVIITLDINTDGATTAEENAGPNAGDYNNDGILDSTQQNVASKPNPNTSGGYSSLVVDTSTGCGDIRDYVFKSEPQLPSQDSQFVYPIGLFGFKFRCAAPGSSTNVTIILDKLYDTSTWKYRKYNNATQQYKDVSSYITYGTITTGGSTVTTIKFLAQDGGPLDEDGVANGTFVDPNGPAITDLALAKTGQNAMLLISSGIILLGLTVLTGAYRRSRQHSNSRSLILTR